MAGRSSDYVDRALAYARDVTRGKIPACKWVRLACRRQLEDLKRAKRKGRGAWRWRFDRDRANYVCQFLEQLPHYKGPLAGTKIELEPWQCFHLTTVFGWVDRESGFRRFRFVYIEVPRGNGKSTETAGLGLYGLAADGEAGAEVYSAAAKHDQAKIIFEIAQRMARLEAGYRDHFGVEVLAHTIAQDATASKFQALSSQYSTLDGLNIHLGLIDELHAHKTRGIYDVLETGAGKRPQSLIWCISTAGSNMAGICYEQRTYVTKILEEVFEDDRYFGIIYTLDEGDDWQDEKSWAKANPNFGISVDPEYLAGLARKAMQLPAAQANFKTKHLNIWVNADAALFDMDAWERCKDLSLVRDQFAEATWYVTLDLATKTDIAARADLCRYEIEGKTHYAGFVRCFLPEAAVLDGRNAHYPGWAEEGYLEVTEGEVTDFELIEGSVLADLENFPIAEVGADPWQASYVLQRLEREGATAVEIRQTVANLSEPTKELAALVLEGRFHHDGNPVLTWMVSNVVGHYDAKENVYPRKERPENKIDGVIALLMALSRAMRHQDEPPPRVNSQDLHVI